MSKTYGVNSLEEALELADNFKETGKYDLFRGQGQNWEVIPSAGRLTKRSHKKNIEKIERLLLYFTNSNLLKKYIDNVDWFFSVAQHYGIPTQYIDFTSNQKIAAYFATNSASNKTGENCVIICLNKNDFSELISFSSTLFDKDSLVPPYIVEPDTENLWRLKAQEGSLLFTPYLNIEPIYTFDKIIFPYKKPYTGIKKEYVYPENKSELEIQIDYFFDNEERLKREKRFKKYIDKMGFPVTKIPENDIFQYLKNNEPCKSWNKNNLEKFNHTFSEDWNKLKKLKEVSLKIRFDENYNKFSEKLTLEIQTLFTSQKICKNTILKINLIFDKSLKLKKKTLNRIETNFSKIWDGTRNLRFESYEIFKIISDYIFLELYNLVNNETYSLEGEELIEIVMSNTSFSLSKSYASKHQITTAIRNNIYEIIIDSFPKQIASEILLYVNNPRMIFNFNKLNNLFKKELIAYQVFYSREEKNPVIFYTPSDLEMLGYK